MSNTNEVIALDKRAYVGAPKPPTKNVLGKEDLELATPRPHWSYKSKAVRRQELLDTL